MKVSEISYKRYGIENAEQCVNTALELVNNANSVHEIVKARNTFNRALVEWNTASSLAYCRFTLNTRDEFYQAEMDYYDMNNPIFTKLQTTFASHMLNSPYRKDAEKLINNRVFREYECLTKCVNDAVIEDLQEENKTVTEYSKFMGELVFQFDGKKMPLSVLVGYFENENREIRKAAAESIGNTLSKNSEMLDDIYDRLVKIRDKIAKKLGYKNYVELGYYRMSRIDYNEDMIAEFRKNVLNDIVPVVAQIKKESAKRLGINRVMYYDNDINLDGEVPKPVVDEKGIFENALEMYKNMSAEIGDFMKKMLDTEAFDVEARDGKFGGGYCTEFAKYKQPFILANFNGTGSDIDVITHEFGHALNSEFGFKYNEPDFPMGMETAECHSMSMEFLCWRELERFFGKSADRYRYKHLLDAISFIPYGVIVDEFQHIVYSNPEMTPAERNNTYLKLEKKYRPYMSFDGIPYLELGTRWQYQMHIYEVPFYYIDYCIARVISLGFLVKSLDNYDKAVAEYVMFSKHSGAEDFDKLVSEAGMISPFANGALKEFSEAVLRIAAKLEAKIL